MRLLATVLALTVLVLGLEAADARIQSIALHSRALEGDPLGDAPDRDVEVYLPPRYDTSPERRYPVVYLLHGWTRHSPDWFGRSDGGSQHTISAALGRSMAANASRELIVVMPHGLNAYLGSRYTNSPVTGCWEDFLTQELVAPIENT